MKYLIYGSKGWIGQQVVNILEKDKKNIIIKSENRCDNEKDIEDEIINLKPDRILSFIGRTHGKIDDKEYNKIDYLEQTGKLKENIRDNLYSPLVLCDICKKRNIHFTYLGTGCIFQYDEEHLFGNIDNGFTEESLPNFFGSSYSIVKGFTDRLMKQYENEVLNLRIRMPINSENNSRNFIYKITNYEKICSVPNSMSVLPELLPYVLKMMEQKTTGTINLTNPGLISHNEILDMYKEIVDPDFTYQNFTIEEQRKILACDRSNNYLDTKKLVDLFPHIKHIKESVRDSLLLFKLPVSLAFASTII